MNCKINEVSKYHLCIGLGRSFILHSLQSSGPTFSSVYINILWWNYSNHKQVEAEIKQMFSLAANCQISNTDKKAPMLYDNKDLNKSAQQLNIKCEMFRGKITCMVFE